MKKGFTLIELLVVIALLGLVAGLTVPALKNIGKGIQTDNVAITLVSDLKRARQLAINNHQTVYMVFYPTNVSIVASNYLNLTTNVTPLNGYCLCSLGKVGDQPGQHQWCAITDWRTFGGGYLIHPNKFAGTPVTNAQWSTDYPSADNVGGVIQPFYNISLPFPKTDSPTSIRLPYVAFDFRGRLVSEFDGVKYHHGVIQIVKGDVQNGVVSVSADSLGIGYSVVDIDPQTGFISLEAHKVK